MSFHCIGFFSPKDPEFSTKFSVPKKNHGVPKITGGLEIPEPWSWDPPFNPSKLILRVAGCRECHWETGVSPKAEFGLDNLWRRANSRPQEAARGSRR